MKSLLLVLLLATSAVQAQAACSADDPNSCDCATPFCHKHGNGRNAVYECMASHPGDGEFVGVNAACNDLHLGPCFVEQANNGRYNAVPDTAGSTPPYCGGLDGYECLPTDPLDTVQELEALCGANNEATCAVEILGSTYTLDFSTSENFFRGTCVPTACSGNPQGNGPPLDDNVERVTICSRTCSQTNPWVRITVAADSWDDGTCAPDSDTCHVSAQDQLTYWGDQSSDYELMRWSKSDYSNSDANALERACPYKQSISSNNPCCDWSKGECCGIPPPASTTTVIESGTTSAGGDPHFETWKGEQYAFHGMCDLELVSVPDLDLTIHIRTQIVRSWSYIQQIAVQIGDEILQVQGGGPDDHHYWINKEYQGRNLKENPHQVFGSVFDLQYKKAHSKQHEYTLTFPDSKQALRIKTYKEFVRIDVLNPQAETFASSVGLWGNYKTGAKLGRDGTTVFTEDNIAFGKEWQVQAGAPILFSEVQGPQLPDQECILPEELHAQEKLLRGRHRRLDQASVTDEQARAACLQWAIPSQVSNCIFDVLATDDLDMAESYAGVGSMGASSY